MTPSPNCITFIQKHEGLVLHPYLDSAHVATVGYGTTRYSDGRHVSINDPSITPETAFRYLMNDIDPTGVSVSEMVTGLNLNQNMYDSLVSFAYNEGVGALHGSTLLKLIKANPNDPNITAAFLMWDKLHKDGILIEDAGLKQRRKEEAALYFTPINSL